MPTPTFTKFLSLAWKHSHLIVDLCAEADLISRSKLLNYMESYAIPAVEKDKRITEFCRAAILIAEADDCYTVNPVVAGVVNYYERRGRLTNASFLRDQILGIATLTDELQRGLVDEETPKDLILDTVDKLYRLVREIREIGDSHYMACMQLLGEMKRTGEDKTVDQRLQELETVQRRHIQPLRELLDPSAEYAHKIVSLKRRMADLGAMSELLAESQELDSHRLRVGLDVQYIDYILLRRFKTISETSRALLNSLLEEKTVKDAMAACLGNLETIWNYLHGTTVLASGRQFSQSPSLEKLGEFFSDVLYFKLLPHPKPLSAPPAQKQSAENVMIERSLIWNSIETAGVIKSWPAFIVKTFQGYPHSEQLKAITLPLIVSHPHIKVQHLNSSFTHNFLDFLVQMQDFDLRWESNHDSITPSKTSGNLSPAVSRLPV